MFIYNKHIYYMFIIVLEVQDNICWATASKEDFFLK